MAGTLLPEIMSYDPTRPASFPSSGRTLTDDAGDAFVAVLTNGKVTKDGVGPHSDLLAEFPYLGRRSLCALLVEPPTSLALISMSTAAAMRLNRRD